MANTFIEFGSLFIVGLIRQNVPIELYTYLFQFITAAFFTTQCIVQLNVITTSAFLKYAYYLLICRNTLNVMLFIYLSDIFQDYSKRNTPVEILLQTIFAHPFRT